MKEEVLPASQFDVELPPAPYPGLRPFEKHEWPVFFGRESMTAEAIRRLLDQNLLVVHGDSGCGKSSLIRAGVLVQLEQRHARGSQHWRTCTMLPREAPLLRLARALAGLKEPEPSRDLVRQIRRVLNAGRAAAAKLEELICTDPTDRICILVDQFEELFRFARETGANEARLFVDVLVGLLEEAERRRKSKSGRSRLYAILTMRSEFLGSCAQFTGLAEAVNQAQYLLPHMERSGLLRAICEPALLYDGEVSRELAERLIADAGNKQDQLPLIQHGLMLLWQGKVHTPDSTASQPNGLADAADSFQQHPRSTWRLDLKDYHGAGNLADLLSAHADKVKAKAESDISAEGYPIEHLFRALTDINAEGHAIRRPQTFEQLRAVTGADEATLKIIIDHFRAEGVSFLTPYGDEVIYADTQIDISHEALIRCWRALADNKIGWLQREFKDGLTWRSLVNQAESFQRDPKSILSAVRSEELDQWLEKIPSADWSERYDGCWHEVEQLMEASRKARFEEAKRHQELEEAKRRKVEERVARTNRIIRRQKIIMRSFSTLGGLILFALLLIHAPVVKQLENWTYDARLNYSRLDTIDHRIVIVDIDENSLAVIGRWPWARDKLATLVDNLFDHYQAKVIGFDIVFAGKDQSSGFSILDELAKTDLKNNSSYQEALARIRPSLLYDDIFAKSLAGKNVVMGYYFKSSLWGDESAVTGLLPPALTRIDAHWSERLPIHKAKGFIANLEILQSSARSGGYFDNPFVDPDGVFRRVPLIQSYEGNLYASLALATTQGFLEAPGVELAVEAEGVKGGKEFNAFESINLKGYKIPVDVNSAVFVPYRGRQGSFPYIPAYKVLSKKANPDALKDKIILIGTSAPGLLDLRSTPVQNIYPGVEVQANIISGILDNRIKHKPSWTLSYELVLLGILTIGMALFLSSVSPLLAAVGTLGLSGVVLVGTFLAWDNHLILPLASSMLLLSSFLVVCFLASLYGAMVRPVVEK